MIPRKTQPEGEPEQHDANHMDRKEAGRHRPPAEGGDAPEGTNEGWQEGDAEEPAEGS